MLLYSLWWVITGAAVVGIVLMLLNTVLGGWITASGWRQLYLLGGAITVVVCLVQFGPAISKELLRMFVNDPMEAVIAIVVLGCIPIIAIPLITVGWPLIWWLAWEDFREKRKEKGSKDVN